MWTLDQHALVPHWRLAAPSAVVTLGFSTRRGGVSAPPFDSLNLGRSTVDDPAHITENRSRLLHALELDPERLVTAGQVHGARVVEATHPGHLPDCDALLTRVPGLALAVTTADCMSLLYVAPGALCAVHAGWRGTEAAMPGAALTAVCDASGAAPPGVDVHIGPCIRGCCYEVGDDVASHFPAAAIRIVNGRARLDLPTVARLQLERLGVLADRIFDTGACTMCEPHWYFSHRRDQGRTGRQWGVAALRA